MKISNRPKVDLGGIRSQFDKFKSLEILEKAKTNLPPSITTRKPSGDGMEYVTSPNPLIHKEDETFSSLLNYEESIFEVEATIPPSLPLRACAIMLPSKAIRYSCNLVFLSFWNNNQEFIGIIDSGAQINLISKALSAKMNYKLTPSPYTRFQGVNGTTTLVLFWIQAFLVLGNGSQIPTTFAVVENISSTLLILGLPFLVEPAATCNFKRLSFTNYNGVIRLIQGPSKISVRTIQKLALCSEEDQTVSNVLQHVLDISARGAMTQLLLKYTDLWKNKKRGVVATIKHEILLTTTDRSKQNAYR
ncbi:aspartyl protease [Gregarina niphandrodes]|uniref:Aspartyl protease n=1 Tax=Gregarina niphandrodes TaxID=110365 RepID=A0A023AW62_GRENI|nr:aspartyl protease [Gregarina niphandrodes]EZG42971.1 aspartyl protease [Gregarina niphandrodes]|eukprot:XP_011133757.1 aspartyl protease [Gregarina niphandrodes]